MFKLFFKQPRLKPWLIAGFIGNLIIIILITVISLTGLYRLKTNFDKYHYLLVKSSQHVQALRIMYNLEAKANSWYSLTKQHVVENNYNEMLAIEKRIVIREKEIDALVKEYASLDFVQSKMKDKFTTHIKELIANDRSYQDKILALSREQKNSKALKLFDKELNSSFENIEDLIKEIRTFSLKRAGELQEEREYFYNDSNRILSLFITIIIILGLISLFASIILGLVMITIIIRNYNLLASNEKILLSQNQELKEKEELLQKRNTSLIKAQAELEYANRELVIINKSLFELDEMKTNFISTVSHELRTPLTSIKGSLGLILNGMAGDVTGEIKTFLDVCYRNTDRLIRLINDLLDISKIESGKINLNKVEFRLAALVNDAVESISAYAIEKRVKIYSNIPDYITVYADRHSLDQVMFNLLSNAIKFSSIRNDKQGIIWINVEQDSDYTIIIIKDNGIGIPENKQRFIFEKFTQIDSSARRNIEGTGLGLAICKALIEEHRGRIWVESIENDGANFSFTIASKAIQEQLDQLSKQVA